MLIIGDIHFDAPVRYQVGGYNLYFEDVKKTLEYVLSEVTREKELVVFLGDYFEKKDKIQNKVKNGLLKVLKKFIKEKGLEYWFVVGNHDIGVDNELSIEMLKGYGRVFSKSKVVKTKEYDVQVVPWNNVGVDIEAVDVVLGHFRVDGAEMGVVLDRGEGCYKISEFEDMFVCDGHYHKYQKLGDRVYCVGSLVQVDWGDRDKKYVCRLDEWGWEFIEVKRYIDRVSVYVDDIEKLKGVDFVDKYARVDVEMDKVDVKDVVRYLQDSGVKWYELNLVRRVERNFDDVLMNGGDDIEEDIRGVVRQKLNEVSEELRSVYKKVVEKVLNEGK